MPSNIMRCACRLTAIALVSAACCSSKACLNKYELLQFGSGYIPGNMGFVNDNANAGSIGIEGNDGISSSNEGPI